MFKNISKTKEYGNFVVIKGRISDDQKEYYKDLCEKDARSIPGFNKLKDYKHFINYKILQDETVIGWKAHD